MSWNYKVKQRIPKFQPRKPDAEDGTWRIAPEDVDRVQEFRKCIECYLCQDVCHVLRDHHMHEQFIGPRFLVYVAALEMHPLDVGNRVEDLRKQFGIGLCNITKCCTKVCPEGITITDNAIIPLKERVVDRFFDPLSKLFRVFSHYESLGGVMDFELKSISVQSIPEALAKAERYRLLNEPVLAESICLDVLAIVPDHQQALISLLLARTDQFHSNVQPKGAQEALARIKGDYEQAYYAGVIRERLGNARIRHGDSGARTSAYHALRDAMSHYERAMNFAPPGNDEAILRWNTCARMIMQNPDIQPLSESDPQAWLRDEASSAIPDS